MEDLGADGLYFEIWHNILSALRRFCPVYMSSMPRFRPVVISLYHVQCVQW